jgi:hypothetical protein
MVALNRVQGTSNRTRTNLRRQGPGEQLQMGPETTSNTKSLASGASPHIRIRSYVAVLHAGWGDCLHTGSMG